MIEAKNLTKYYGSKPAIRDVSFHIKKGEVAGLLGPNGAGKTTIIRILTCYMHATSGIILVDGLDCSEFSLQVRRMIGFLPESVPLYSDLSVDRFLGFSGTIKGLKGKQLKDAINRVISLCGLEEHRRRLIRHLSKGLKQRVGLAQALINDPPVLVLDEPTTGLDPAQIVEIRELIRSLKGKRTILLSTHILPEASQLCDKVLIIDNGKILREDSPHNLAREVQKGMRTRIQVQAPEEELRSMVLSINGVWDIKKGDRDYEWIVESERSDTIRPIMARSIVKKGWPLMEMREDEIGLEQVFIHLVTEERHKV
jgi:ABC-2 type transport system ATP-binding protein